MDGRKKGKKDGRKKRKEGRITGLKRRKERRDIKGLQNEQEYFNICSCTEYTRFLRMVLLNIITDRHTNSYQYLILSNFRHHPHFQFHPDLDYHPKFQFYPNFHYHYHFQFHRNLYYYPNF